MQSNSLHDIYWCKYPSAAEKERSALKTRSGSVISEANRALLNLHKMERSKLRKLDPGSSAYCSAVEKQEEIYRHILTDDPHNAFALFSYAHFLSNFKKDNRGADHYFQLSLKADPFHSEVLMSYAYFLERRLHDLSKAHRFYKRAYFADRYNTDVLCAYAIFQYRSLRNFKEADKLFKKVSLYFLAERERILMDAFLPAGLRG